MLNKIAFALCVASLPACVDQPDQPEIFDEPRLIGNGLTPVQLWGAALQSTVLDATNLQTMASTEDGRAALTYVIGCALASGHNVSTTYDPGDGSSVPITFNGLVGLADSWTSVALTTTQQRWVSSCVLGRVNRTGATVTVSMRGTLSNFAVAFGETTNYPVQEGAFFGNIFYGPNFYVAACKGSGNPGVAGRDCAKADVGQPGYTQCDYVYAGTCSSICSVSSGVFTSCNHNGQTWSQPVTTYTQF